MKIKTIKSIQEVYDLLQNDFKSNLLLKDKYFYFIDTLIKHRVDKKAKYFSSKNFKKTFGDNTYKAMVNYFIAKGIIERFYNYQGGKFGYYKYKLLISAKNLINYQITSQSFIKTIDYFNNTNYQSLLDFEKQVLHNIEQLQLSSEFDIPRLYMSKSKNTGRLFHTITNMPKIQRHNLKHVDDFRLVEIDAKNAQLVMLSHLFNDDEVFNDAVYSGKFYEILASEMGIDISDDNKRGEFKRKFFNSILFNENTLVVANSKYGVAFKKLFPKTFHHLIEMQVDKSRATELQRTESNLFINNITKDLVESGYFVIPIHDAFIIKHEDIDKVQKIINDNCYSILGRLITMSITEFCPTPLCGYATYNNLRKKEEEREDNRQEGLYVVQSEQGVGQNNNTIVKNEKIALVTDAIKTLMAENQKITIRKIQELSGVAKATVEKHYKGVMVEINKINNDVVEKPNW
ncbi:hypothetical protein OX284_011625 [Flavobacterium sp. SUN046]|uniref:hypothetical protein n=1 Tax=Flavobacterium sp. SUN046 TaxID=3002440 RepID=UPI002DBC009E|nr:hypothetical protein [Flavobacterium sp. SUN046]MEC4050082.1 hypothetical protein [Flavobacterium sp. SUN046]